MLVSLPDAMGNSVPTATVPWTKYSQIGASMLIFETRAICTPWQEQAGGKSSAVSGQATSGQLASWPAKLLEHCPFLNVTFTALSWPSVTYSAEVYSLCSCVNRAT
jgi:hypothetical protein